MNAFGASGEPKDTRNSLLGTRRRSPCLDGTASVPRTSTAIPRKRTTTASEHIGSLCGLTVWSSAAREARQLQRRVRRRGSLEGQVTRRSIPSREVENLQLRDFLRAHRRSTEPDGQPPAKEA